MLKPTNYGSSSSVVGQWETLGESLSNALSAYLKSCISLETFFPQDNEEAQQLASRIDSSLNTLHVKLSQKLTQSRVVLARTRNKALSRFSSLPNEVITAIFMDVVYAPAPDDFWNPSMALSLKTTFKCLYKLLSVCSSWRNFAISLGDLWVLVPMASSSMGHSTSRVAPLILERSQASSSRDRPLHLAGTLSHYYYPTVPLLNDEVPRFKTVNIESENISVISSVIRDVLRTQWPWGLSELSLHYAHNERPHPQASNEPIRSRMLIIRDSFAKLMGSLTSLRIRGLNIPWEYISFSNRLITLRLQSLVLGDKSRLVEFLRSLQSAPELEDLKIISVVAFSPLLDSDGGSDEDEPGPRFKFPKLQSLLLEDLNFYTLEILLSHIVPGSHQTKLFLTSKSVHIHQWEETRVVVEPEPYYALLQRSKIDTLLLNGDLDNEAWLDYTPLSEVIQSLPTLKTLKIVNWEFKTKAVLALERPKHETSDLGARPFPSLDILCIDGNIWDMEPLSRVIASHPLRTMKLSGNVPFLTGAYDFNPPNSDGAPSSWLELSDDDDNLQELKTTFPHFQFWDDAFKDEDFGQGVWKLW